MATIECSTEGCKRKIVYLKGKTTVLIGPSAAGGVTQGEQTSVKENVILTLQCLDGHINNYEFKPKSEG